MTSRLTFLLLLLCLVGLSNPAAAEGPIAVIELAQIFAPAEESLPMFLSGGTQKSGCTAVQDNCPGGGTVSCIGVSSCTVKCGLVKCDGDGEHGIRCANPCCSQTVTCLDGSTITCQNWKSTNCSPSATGVQCDGVCPPPDPCDFDPCQCFNPPSFCRSQQ